ncbi:MAG: Uma2 family endonuclease [Leptolyngbyaceae cyanobacterium SM1_1_3]|nr:Uma2 family endonuclease [Leptolyngbyaceae cyanobacterium SM1_1_3]NJN04339.1 Uma2 family endonuclease [Leptolyngbyaceae cyanobacterium RM1_1_2]NJO10553.1 Uma2 family endonuclease [Leptolyngbyaceae cyanobacterium SL_1_1]
MVSQPLNHVPLEAGDRLTRPEFHRRCADQPSLKRAELLEGIVYMPAALRFKSHGQPHGRITAWLGLYEATTPYVSLGDNATVQLDLDNEPQPDAVLLIQSEAGGQSSLSQDDYIVGAPELHDKKRAYRRNGVQEYLVWQVFDRVFNWFYLAAGDYQPLAVDPDGIIRSRQFPRLWLAVEDLLAGRMLQVFAELQQGLNSPEHAEFVSRLSAAANAENP